MMNQKTFVPTRGKIQEDAVVGQRGGPRTSKTGQKGGRHGPKKGGNAKKVLANDGLTPAGDELEGRDHYL